METNPQPQAPQQVYPPSPLQDGVSPGYTPGASTGMVGRVHRPKGCLPASSHRAFSQEMARFLYRRNPIPVQLPPVRIVDSSSNIHEDRQSGGRTSEAPGTPNLCIPGRLAPGSAIARQTPLINLSDLSSSRQAGSTPQHREVQPDSIPTDRISGIDPGFPAEHGLPDSRASQQHCTLRKRLGEDRTGPGRQVDAPARPHRQPGIHPPVLQIPDEDYPAACSVGVQYPPPTDDKTHTNLPQSSLSNSLVDASSKSSGGTSIHIRNLYLHPHHRRLQDWMGSSFPGDPDVRIVEPEGSEETHQHPRALGDPPGSSSDHSPGQRPKDLSEVRQHVGGDIHQQTGRYKEQVPMPADAQTSAVVPTARDRALSSPSPRGGQHISRCSLQESDGKAGSVQGPGVISRVASPAGRLPDDLQQDREALDRPLCQQGQLPAPDVLLLGQGPSSIPPRRNDNGVGGHQRLRISSNCSRPSSSPPPESDEAMSHDPDLSTVAQAGLVPEAPVPSGRHSQDSSQEEGPDQDSENPPSDGDDRDDQPDCLATLIRTYRAAGLSEQAASLAAAARRDSTRKTYNSRLRKYFGWCTRQQVDPLHASLGEVGDFFMALYNEGKSYRNIRNHRTAINVVHRGFEDGTKVSSSTALQALVRGIFNERPPERSLVPDWDLPSALRLLSETPFEPLGNATLEDLTKKTVFLVAAASGRRVSDLHALSVAGEHLSISSSGARLLPRSGYLSKNQTPDFTPSPIILPDLRKAANSPDDGPWCPVRALKFYLEKTKHLRGQEDRLFLITRKPYSGASKQSIARWLTDIIKESVAVEDSHRLGSRVGAHSIRSQASAWASYKGASLSDIINAMGWSSTTTFQTTYLKDVYARGGATAARVLSSASRGTAAARTSNRTDS